jgi:hypothetical protein
MRVRHIVIRGLQCSTNYFINFTVLERMILNTKFMFWFSLQLYSEPFLIIRRNIRDVIQIHVGLHVEYPVFFSDFNDTWIFWKDFRKIRKISNFMKTSPVRAELFHVDGRTDGRTRKKWWSFSEFCETRLKKIREIIRFTRHNKVISVKETAFTIIIILGNKQKEWLTAWGVFILF